MWYHEQNSKFSLQIKNCIQYIRNPFFIWLTSNGLHWKNIRRNDKLCRINDFEQFSPKLQKMNEKYYQFVWNIHDARE